MKDINGRGVWVGDTVAYIHRTGIYSHESKLVSGKVVAVSAKVVAVEVGDELYTTDSCLVIPQGVT